MRSTRLNACERVEPLLGAYAEHQLNIRRAREVEAHLRSCPSCRAALDAMKGTKDLLEQAAVVPPLPPSLHASLMQVVQADVARSTSARPRVLRYPLRRAGVIAASACLVLVLSAVIAMGGRSLLATKDAMAPECDASNSVAPMDPAEPEYEYSDSDSPLLDAIDPVSPSVSEGGTMPEHSDEGIFSVGTEYTLTRLTTDKSEGEELLDAMGGEWKGDGVYLRVQADTATALVDVGAWVREATIEHGQEGVLLSWEDGFALLSVELRDGALHMSVLDARLR